jgi:leucyl aminopeptidase
MEKMKGDMCGAAAVLGTMDALGRLGAPVSVTGLIVTAENLLDGQAMRPGDILVYPNGKSVQVENTDAEGRLILADGLLRCAELKATHAVDVATLTGACARALGPSFTGLMGNARELVNAITRAGGNHGESYWKLPLPMEYKEMLKNPVADLNNVGGQYAGAITAGLFLQEFVPEKIAWAHLDIAGTFWKEKAWKYFQEGPSGVGVRTLVELARNWGDYISG